MLVEVDDSSVLTVAELGQELAGWRDWKFVAANNDMKVGMWDIKFLDRNGSPLYMTLDGWVYNDEKCWEEACVEYLDIRDALDIELVWGRLTYNDGTPDEPVAIVNR